MILDYYNFLIQIRVNISISYLGSNCFSFSILKQAPPCYRPGYRGLPDGVDWNAEVGGRTAILALTLIALDLFFPFSFSVWVQI